MDLYSCIECGHNQPQLGALDTVVAASLNVDLCEYILDFLVLDGFGVVTNDGAFTKENDHHLSILVVVPQLTNGFHNLIRRKNLIVPMRLYRALEPVEAVGDIHDGE